MFVKYSLSMISVSVMMALPSLQASMIVTENYNFLGLNESIPDGDPSGVASFQAVAGSAILDLQKVEVSLVITGTYNGDLYAYLQHDSGLAILLNRSGKTAGNAFGYGDDGFDVTFSDSASNNIHNYQDTVTPGSGNSLTGMWQPDGRLVDPDSVIDTDPSTAPLSVFNGLDSNGSWTIFVADLSGGEGATLESWSLSLTGDSIPEASVSSFTILAATGLLMSRRRKNVRG